MDITAVLGEREREETNQQSIPPTADSYGWTLQDLDTETARTLGDPDLQGVLVADVDPYGKAGHAGVQPGDVILEVDGYQVSQPGEVERLMSSADDILLLIWRQGHSIYFML
jgi:serine protease Do